MSIFNRIKAIQYLNTDNTEQYRPIVRIFYEQHLKFSSYLSFQEVYQLLRNSEYWRRFELLEYTEKNLETDLKMLVEWGDLEVIQDNTKATSYEDYQKKKYRYKASEILIDIERMLIATEKRAGTIRGGLEKQVADRILEELAKIANNHLTNPEEVYYIWRDLMRRHDQLRNDTSDYLSLINAESTEKLLRSESFIPYKGQFVSYLDGFVAHIAEKRTLIQKRLREMPTWHIDYTIQAVVDFERKFPQFLISQEEYDVGAAKGARIAEWNALKSWFIEEDGRESGFSFLIKQTRGAISKVLRIAQQIGEKAYQYKSRKNDYLQIARWFYDAKNLDECHMIASYMFGTQEARHVFALPKTGANPYQTVWENDPYEIELRKTTRAGRARKRSQTVNEDPMKEFALLNEHQKNEELKREYLELITTDRIIRIRDITVAHPMVREAILDMVGRATVSSNGNGITEEGRRFKMRFLSNELEYLRCPDGTLTMGDIEIQFMEEAE
ncbi:uncharacterized protein (TIGR02677 family) [Paenibacillus cellulosilyticus]|uniref:Uncharacterized protein (TIGR02677 family) n=1 Tax=Paenibacillus cellulosilyticus TaxID=375489 RepID=A0A2V2YLQ0_9BACL|nr:TIGR02677 family protein [Paenibacillus cellulosilyticus]PWV94545.1 uncharacterized protein (TIGR02677 family) [Paenibacillus cellulosilyticus]QKS45049.1 TIGR02677 family protein [Paenibacillus cellulosilyticus]